MNNNYDFINLLFQEIVEALISHVGDGMVNECDCALEVMESLVENHRTEMERFTSLIKVSNYINRI